MFVTLQIFSIHSIWCAFPLHCNSELQSLKLLMIVHFATMQVKPHTNYTACTNFLRFRLLHVCPTSSAPRSQYSVLIRFDLRVLSLSVSAPPPFQSPAPSPFCPLGPPPGGLWHPTKEFAAGTNRLEGPWRQIEAVGRADPKE